MTPARARNYKKVDMKDITITDQAKTKIVELLEKDPEAKNRSIRILLNTDGNKFQYTLRYDDKVKNDIAIPVYKERGVLIENSLSSFLSNAVIDWNEKGKFGKGFSINRNIKPVCPCGSPVILTKGK